MGSGVCVGVGSGVCVGVGVGVGVGVDPGTGVEGSPVWVDPPTVAGPVLPGPQTRVLLDVLVDDELVTVPVVGSTVVVGVCTGADPLVMWQFEPYGDAGGAGVIVATTGWRARASASRNAARRDGSTCDTSVVCAGAGAGTGAGDGVSVGDGRALGDCGRSTRTETVCGSWRDTACAGAPITTDCANASAIAAMTAVIATTSRGRRAGTRAEAVIAALPRTSRATLSPKLAARRRGAPTPRSGPID